MLETRYEEARQRAEATGAERRPSNWGGILVRPEVIEFWQGRRSRLHDRLRFTRATDGWTVDRLAP